jgi:muconolactone D-isomerase
VELSDERRQELLSAEYERARELVTKGAIERIWRIPGGLKNVGIWRAADGAELQALLSSLPLSPYLESKITPLAKHPIEQDDCC